MNKKRLIATGGGILLLGAGYVGAAYLGGRMVQDSLEQGYSEFNRKFPEAHITVSSRKQGVFSSEQRLKVALGCDRSVSFDLIQHIQHGPVLGAAGTGWAKVRTEIVYPQAVQAELTKVFKQQAPLTFDTRIKLGGELVTQIGSPAVDVTEDGSRVKWQGLQGEITFRNVALRQSKVDLTMPGLSVTLPSAVVADVGKIRIQGDSLQDTSGLGLGKSLVTIDSGRLTIPSSSSAMGFSKLNASATQGATGGFADMVHQISLEQVQINGQDYGPAHYDFSLRHLHVASLLQLLQGVERLRSQECNPDPDQFSATLDSLKPALQTLLKQQPRLAIERLSVKLPEGTSLLTASATLDAVTDNDFQTADFGSPLQHPLLQKLRASADIRVPAATVEAMIARQDERAEMLRAQLAMAIAQGVVVEQDGQLRLQARLEQGKPLVNGKPLDALLANAGAGATE